jgi:hypothetical protein
MTLFISFVNVLNEGISLKFDNIEITPIHPCNSSLPFTFTHKKTDMKNWLSICMAAVLAVGLPGSTMAQAPLVEDLGYKGGNIKGI